ncbi:MAG: hypothetical protein JWM05_3784 [Acidimicrobiales bacterium]|nr:hypothetical protein [Acidimicrobiales bacterium]
MSPAPPHAGVAVDDPEPFTDEELAELALGADPDQLPGDDDPCLWDVLGARSSTLLPEWYMPALVGATPLRAGWRRRVAILLVVAFLVINAYGLCSTYGHVVIA